MGRFDQLVETLADAHGYPRWMAHLLMELACLESYAAHRRLLALGFTRPIMGLDPEATPS